MLRSVCLSVCPTGYVAARYVRVELPPAEHIILQRDILFIVK